MADIKSYEELQRLQRALKNLIESEDKRIAQREEAKRKEKEREERRKQLYRYFYGSPSPMTLYVPKKSSLLKTDKRNEDK